MSRPSRLPPGSRGFRPVIPLLPIVLVGDNNAFQFSDGYVDVVGLLRGTADPSENFVNIENDGVPGFNPDNLVSPTLVNPLNTLPEAERYSFIFQGVSQVLDHALISQSANRYFSDFGYMRGNADYWRGFEDDQASVARSSDHDGLVLILEPPPVATSTQSSTTASNRTNDKRRAVGPWQRAESLELWKSSSADSGGSATWTVGDVAPTYLCHPSESRVFVLNHVALFQGFLG